MSERSFEDIVMGVGRIFIRLLGFFLLLMGLWIAIQVLLAAEDLYRNPANIERFAAAVEKGSNIDKTLASFNVSGAKNGGESDDKEKDMIKISYFFAWIIALLLLLLIGRISLAAIKTGGELALFDMQIKHFARILARESRKTKD